MKARLEQRELVSTTQGMKIVLILEIREGKEEAEKMKNGEYYDLTMVKEEPPSANV